MLDHESIPVHTVRPRGIFQFADKQLIESLVSRGWDIDTRDESTSASPSDGKRLLEYFIRKRYGKEHLARWIIDEKNAAVENTSTSTILETCASFGSVAMFKFLEKRGATLSPGTLHGAVETAASKGVDPDTDADDAEMLRYLVDERGLDVNVIDDNAGTPICCAARWERGVAVVRWLLRKGADPDLEDKDGRDALEFAREGKCHEVLALLEDWKRGG
ncbi:ankyrin repeat-containing domain protein [Poronia punctata]|nr:ankyrin repeat-containing domain protein [Poronia punctata]